MPTVLRLEQEALPDDPVEPLLLAPALRARRAGSGRAGCPASRSSGRARRPRTRRRCRHTGTRAAPRRRIAAWSTSWPARRVSLPTQRPCDEEPAMVVDEEEQARPHGARCPRMGHEGTHEHVADPALVRERRPRTARTSVRRAAARRRVRPRRRNCSASVRSAMRTPWRARMISLMWAALRAGTARGAGGSPHRAGPGPAAPRPLSERGRSRRPARPSGAVPADPAVEGVAADRPELAAGAVCSPAIRRTSAPRSRLRSFGSSASAIRW